MTTLPEMTPLQRMTKLQEMLDPFGIDASDLMNYLKDTGIIAGSFAMASLIPDFGPINDMDIFSIVPFMHRYSPLESEAVIAYFKSVTDWFSQYGYTEDTDSYTKTKNDYDFSRFIFKVQTFRHITSGKKIDFVHITQNYRSIFSESDFTISDTYIMFNNEYTPSGVYTPVYISNHYDDLVNKRLVLCNISGLFRTDYYRDTKRGPFCPLDEVIAPKRLARLEKYLTRGFQMIPKEYTISYRNTLVNEEFYRARLAMFM